MKANELMIGDLVQLTISHNPVIIDGITYDSKISKKHLIHFFYVNDGDARWNYSPESFEPIPLTPEILEKNGFYLNGIDKHNTMSINIEYGKWSYENEDGFDVVGDGHDIKFVHELQHALRICGIDKEIMI